MDKINASLENRKGKAIFSSFLRVFFRLLYNEFAWTYDTVAWSVSLGLWQSWIKSCLKYLPGEMVLELGHGPGHLAKSMSGAGKHVMAIDQSREMGRLAYKRLTRAGFSPHLVRGDAGKLPFVSSSFDHVAATFPTEYIFSQITLEEAFRIINPGGTVVVTPAAWITGTALQQRLAALLFRVTGQAPADDFDTYAKIFSNHFTNVGFKTTVQKELVGPSIVMILIAEKPGD